MTELSVVLIARNQAWNIRRLIESVIKGTSCASSVEIIFVDSASTDETVELARRYPVHIFRLKFGQRLSPAIGRYVGYKQTRGKYVLFLDGDTQLLAGWLAEALRVMNGTPDLGAVTGTVINLPTSAAAQVPPAPPRETPTAPPKEVLWCNYGGGGAALYRRSVLEQVGTFDPYLSSEEEPELGLRIRHAGYRILELSRPMAYHFNDAPVALSNVLSRRRRRFHLGVGQAARHHLGSKLFWSWLEERWWEPAATLLLASGLIALFLSLITPKFILFGLWVLALLALIVCAAIRKRSIRAAFVAAFSWLVMAEGFLRGFLMRPLPRESFQAKIEPDGESREHNSAAASHVRESPDIKLQYSSD
jgi:glycosyltransferase involved in cell wall biosynthesis